MNIQSLFPFHTLVCYTHVHVDWNSAVHTNMFKKYIHTPEVPRTEFVVLDADS